MLAQDDVIYFILTDRFNDGDLSNNIETDRDHPLRYHGGDFKGIIEKIPYLKDLGITALWITPVYLSIGRLGADTDGYHGYWALDFNKIDPHLSSTSYDATNNGKTALKVLCETLHQNSIKLILDMVVNHTGYHNETYQQYSHTLPDHWFHHGGYGTVEGELAGLPDLDHDQPDVRDYFVNNILSWIEETGIDAIRMDTVKHVEDAFWYFFKSYIKGKYRDVTLIGEVLDEHNIPTIARYQTQHDFDTLFDFPLRTATVDTLVRGGTMMKLARPRLSDSELPGILDLDTKYYANANRLVTLLDNHDLSARIKTEILNTWGHWDRHRANRILKLCLSFLFTTRGIPQLYYGTEIGLEGDADPYNRRDMRWEVFDPTFNAHPNDTEYQDAREIFDYTHALIRIRKENPALCFGYLFTLYVDHFIYAFMRSFKENTVIVVINNGLEAMPGPLTIEIEANSNIPSRIKKNLEGCQLRNLLITNDEVQCSQGRLKVQLAGKEAKIYKHVSV